MTPLLPLLSQQQGSLPAHVPGEDVHELTPVNMLLLPYLSSSGAFSPADALKLTSAHFRGVNSVMQRMPRFQQHHAYRGWSAASCLPGLGSGGRLLENSRLQLCTGQCSVCNSSSSCIGAHWPRSTATNVSTYMPPMTPTPSWETFVCRRHTFSRSRKLSTQMRIWFGAVSNGKLPPQSQSAPRRNRKARGPLAMACGPHRQWIHHLRGPLQQQWPPRHLKLLQHL